jgi:hypothetical protein
MDGVISVGRDSSSQDTVSPEVGRSNTRFQYRRAGATDFQISLQLISSAIVRKGYEQRAPPVDGTNGVKHRCHEKKKRVFAKTTVWVGERLAH